MISFHPVIIHVDMDAFFAAVEMRNNPGLKGKPVIVGGGVGQRGVVSTCSYEARRYGVHSGMAATMARRLCPEGVFIEAGLRGYVYASACLLKIFQKYTPIVEPLSVDEAFLDITGTERLFGGPEELVRAMKKEIWETMQLTCSVGVAPGKYLAKLASGLEKPDGVTIMDRPRFEELFYPRPVIALWGVGESTQRSLNARGIYTVSDLARADTGFLTRVFGKNGETLSVMSRGDEKSSVLNYEDLPHDKSMSHETTVDKDLQDPSQIKAILLWLSDKVARRMRRGRYVGRTISVKVRASDFSTITRSHTLTHPTDRCGVVFHHALRLVPKEYGLKFKVRLLGVQVSHLQKREKGGNESVPAESKGPVQLTLLEDTAEAKIGSLIKAVDAVRDKFGERSVILAGTIRE